jgi:hypothetical protein
LPGGFYSVAAGEQGGVSQHTIQQQGLVGRVAGRTEALRVAELHVRRRQPKIDVGRPDLEAERDPLVGLGPEREDVRRNALSAASGNIKCGGSRNWIAISWPASAYACPNGGRRGRWST